MAVSWSIGFREECSGRGDQKSTGDKAKNLLLYPKGTGEPQKFTKDGEEHGQVCVSGGPLWGRRAVRAELLAQ